MGAVYLAEDQRLPTNWAIKEMKKEGLSMAEQESAAQLFRAEARLLSELRHRNLPRIVDFFEEGDQLYLVMDYIDGQTLEQRVERQGPLSLNFSLELCLQISDVLDYLHTRKDPVIFRDFKPANVMFTSQDEVKLIDFGIARVFRQGQSSDTQALGTPGYAAPEQYGKGQSGPRTDLYAFGATLHHALTGRDPTDEPFVFPPITDYRQDLPEDFVALLTSCLNLHPEQRPESAFAIKRELERILGRTGTSSLVAGRPSTTRLDDLPSPDVSSPAEAAAPSKATSGAFQSHTVPMVVPAQASAESREVSVPNSSEAESKNLEGNLPSTTLPDNSESVVSDPEAGSPSLEVVQVAFKPSVLDLRSVSSGARVRGSVKVSTSAPGSLVSSSENLIVAPSSLKVGSQRITVTLDAKGLAADSTFEARVYSESGGSELQVKASIIPAKASLGVLITAFTLCLCTLIPVLNYIATSFLGLIMLLTPKGQRSSLSIPFWLSVFLSLGWTVLLVAGWSFLSQMDWSSFGF